MIRSLLILGRVSNLPTVWTNVAAGLALAGASVRSPQLVVIGVSVSLMYVAGMYLNDAFDRAHDAEHRPERPIPSGQISAGAVFAAGFTLLAGGLALLVLVPGTLIWGLALAAAIVIYDVAHRTNPVAPVVMGACRMLVYLVAASAAGSIPSGSLVSGSVAASELAAGSLVAGSVGLAPVVGGAALLCYVVGLTHAARSEHLGAVGARWPLALLAMPLVFGLWRIVAVPPSSTIGLALAAGLLVALAVWLARCVQLLMNPGPATVPRAVGGLIAGIALVDGVAIASSGDALAAGLAVAAFAATIVLQRVIPGT